MLQNAIEVPAEARMVDVAVIGAGPAGWAVATALAEVGLKTACIAPQPDAPWTNTYGVWVDELAAIGLEAAIGFRWPQAEVVLPAGESLPLDRPYGLVDNAHLRRLLSHRAVGTGLSVVQDRVDSVEPLAAGRLGRRLRLAAGSPLTARIVIDATGHGALRQASRPPPAKVAAQVAFGRTLHGPHPFAEGRMVLMDYTPHADRDGGPPSFLYAMPLGPDRVFVEETVLVARPPPPFDLLERRLDLRLARRGINLTRAPTVERVFIPMGGPVAPAGGLLPFGAAAGMVHPATGYMLANALTAAGPLARGVAQALSDHESDPKTACKVAYEALWPEDRIRMWAWYRVGMEVLLRMNRTELGGFLSAFFSVSPESWSRYLSASGSAKDVETTMARVFARAAPSTKLRVVRSLIGRPGLQVLRHLWQA